MKRNALLVWLIVALLLPATAMAAGKIAVKVTAEKEVIALKNGKPVTKLIPTSKFAPGEVIVYTISYSNTGNAAVTNAVVDDPVPAGTTYIANSASSEGADLTFSVDGGKSYSKPTLLFYEMETTKGKKEKQVATPDKYTNIRWTIPTVPVGGSGKVTFKVKVK